MKILLICPASEALRVTEYKRKRSIKRIMRSNRISLQAVAAATPENVSIHYVDEHIEPIPFRNKYDIVGISVTTGTANRAYEISNEFRKMNTTVVLGGYHPSLNPEEALNYADSICAGEADRTWPELIKDFQNGKLKKIYKDKELFDLDILNPLRRDILNEKFYKTTNLILTGRGCIHKCRFCSVAKFHNYTHRTRPVHKIIGEIKEMKGKLILFGDDNIIANRQFAKDLFKELIPLKKVWMSQGNISLAEDDELLDLAEKSGCIGLFVGFETLNDESLKVMQKDFYKASDYSYLVKKLNKRGIAVMGGFILGLDNDTTEVFSRTLSFASKINLPAAQFAILTPFPGTEIFDELDSEKRIFCKDWSKYDFWHCVYTPKMMSSEELQYGIYWLHKKFYSTYSIMLRLFHTMTYWKIKYVLKYALPLNIGWKLRFMSDTKHIR